MSNSHLNESLLAEQEVQNRNANELINWMGSGATPGGADGPTDSMVNVGNSHGTKIDLAAAYRSYDASAAAGVGEPSTPKFPRKESVR